MLTALLVMVVLAATARTSNAAVAGVPIGLALVVADLVAVPVDGHAAVASTSTPDPTTPGSRG